MNEKEKYWIAYYNSYENGYNSNRGGENVTERGEEHPMSKLTNEQVIEIKEALKNTLVSQYQLAEQYNISQTIISYINSGVRWGFLGEYSYPIRKQNRMRQGTKSPRAVLTDELVMEIRRKSVEKTPSQLTEEYKNICSASTIQKVVRGASYAYLPYYDRKNKNGLNQNNLYRLSLRLKCWGVGLLLIRS